MSIISAIFQISIGRIITTYEVTEMALTTTSLDIPLVAKGKVRDIYALPSSPSTLLFIATDRVLSLLLPSR
jgi:hypothetical protein